MNHKMQTGKQSDEVEDNLDDEVELGNIREVPDNHEDYWWKRKALRNVKKEAKALEEGYEESDSDPDTYRSMEKNKKDSSTSQIIVNSGEPTPLGMTMV